MSRNNLLTWLSVFTLFGGICGAAEQPRVEIDVLIVFDRFSAQELRGSMSEWGQRAVNNLQQAMVNSNLGDAIHFNLKGVIGLENYTNAILRKQAGIIQQTNGNMEAAAEGLVAVQAEGAEEDYLNIICGRIPGLLELRNRHQADLLLMAEAYDFPTLYGMGMGYSLEDELRWDTSSQQAAIREPFLAEKNFVGLFYYRAMVIPQDGVDVFVHEMMHLFGCGHSDRQKAGPGPFYYPDSSAFHTDDFRYGTIMGYPWQNVHIPHPTVPHVSGDTHTLTCLSGNYAPRLHGNDTNLPNLPNHMGDLMHNNRMVALRNAALLGAFRMSGNESVLNAEAAKALPMPPMIDSRTWAMNALSQEDMVQDVTEVLSYSIPGLTRQGALTTLVFGTNNPAPVATGNVLPGGSGKSVWYKLTPPSAGAMRIGIRRAGTDAGFNPVLSVRYADNSPCNPTPLTSAEADGYLQCLECRAEAHKELLIQVDSGNHNGGQFSLVAQLMPERAAANRPTDTPNAPQTDEPTADTPTPQDTPSAPHPSAADTPTPQDTPATQAPAAPLPAVEQPQSAPAATGGNSWHALDTLLLLLSLFSSATSVFLLIKTMHRKPAPEPERTPWQPQPTGKQLVLQGRLYNGTQQEYTYPIARLISEGQVTLGYDSSCGIRITDDTVSGRHAVIEYSPDISGLTIADLGSTNGTRISGKRLARSERAKLHSNEEIQLGLAKFTITIRQS